MVDKDFDVKISGDVLGGTEQIQKYISKTEMSKLRKSTEMETTGHCCDYKKYIGLMCWNKGCNGYSFSE